MRKVYETFDSEDEVDVVIDKAEKGLKSGSVSNPLKVPLISFSFKGTVALSIVKDSYIF